MKKKHVEAISLIEQRKKTYIQSVRQKNDNQNYYY